MSQFEETACACAACVRMCRTFPCRPLPHEVLRMPPAIQARLMANPGGAGLYGVAHMQAPEREHEGKVSTFEVWFGQTNRPLVCAFLTADGRCELHGVCKPFEGRVAHHDDRHGQSIIDRIRAAWDTPVGRLVMRIWGRRHGVET